MMLVTVQYLFQDMVNQIGIETGFKQINHRVGRLHLIDSSIISLCLTRYRWASFRKTKSGIKVHLRLRLFEKGVTPDVAIITTAKKADRTQMDELIVEEDDAFNVFDRTYVDYKKFDECCEKNVRFASRLKKNAAAELTKELPVKPGSKIKKDSTVRLGKKGTTLMKHPMRLIETEDSEDNPIIIITNDFKLSAEEIGDIYRNRWQIGVSS